MLTNGIGELLAQRGFLLLWLGRSLSAIGDRMVPVAAAFAVFEVGGSASGVGLVLAAGVIPNVVFLLLGGVAGDRWRRNRVMLGADAVRACSQSMVAVLLLTGRATVGELAVGAAVWGSAAAFFMPASTGIVPHVVASSQLQRANAFLALTRNIIGFGAPAAAGLAIAVVGAGAVFAIDAGSFLASAVCLVLIRLPATPVVSSGRLVDELKSGWRELSARRWLWISILSFGLWSAGLAAFFVLGPVVAVEHLSGARSWGVIMSGSGLGAILGGVVAMRWRPKRPLVAVFAAALFGPVQMILLVPPAATLLIAASAAAAMVGVSVSVAIWATTLQQQIPERALSKVSAYDWLGSLVAMPVGYAAAGLVAAEVGIRGALLLAASLMLVAAGGALATPAIRNMHASVESQDDGDAASARPDQLLVDPSSA